MPKLELNRKGVRTKLTAAWGRANERLEANFVYELGSPKWGWPGTTVRSTGRVVGSPRDVRDTGDLIGSYSRRKVDPTSVAHTWGVNYAAAVHEGARLRSGVQLPARPFTHEPLKHLAAVFAEEADK